MYFYQQNFIYDVSSYTKTKNTTNNSITISNIDISDLGYYYNTNTKPQVLLSTGNFSPWGAKDVLLSDSWNISYNSSTNTYTLTFFISNTDITSYDINQIKYLIFLDKVYKLQISSSDKRFKNLRLKNNTLLRVKFNNNTTKDFYLSINTILEKSDTQLKIYSPHQFYFNSVSFNTNAQQEIIIPYSFPHFITLQLQRPSNTTSRILRVSLIFIDSSNSSVDWGTYYFSSPSGQTLNTFTLVPVYANTTPTINNNSSFKIILRWTSDGNTLTTENTTINIRLLWFLPTMGLIINF